MGWAAALGISLLLMAMLTSVLPVEREGPHSAADSHHAGEIVCCEPGVLCGVCRDVVADCSAVHRIWRKRG